MRPLELVRSYLRDPASVDPSQVGHPFVTISRQSCAGGHRLARAIVARLERLPDHGWNQYWAVCDQRTCAALAADPTISACVHPVRGQECGDPCITRPASSGGRLNQEQFRHIEAVIRALGRLGRVVIIGRGAMCATAQEPAGVHIRLVAELADRVRHLQTVKLVSEDAARAWIADQDAAHRHLVRAMYGRDIEDPLLYHMVFNTSHITIEDAAEAVVHLLESRQLRSSNVSV